MAFVSSSYAEMVGERCPVAVGWFPAFMLSCGIDSCYVTLGIPAALTSLCQGIGSKSVSPLPPDIQSVYALG